jgi:hypothetical protein
MSNLEGKIQVQSDLVPTNNNPRTPVTTVKYVKGAGQTFVDIAELVAFHPNKMIEGMTAAVINWPTVGTITKFVLNAEPATLLDANNDSIVTIDNFTQYWDVETQVNTSQIRVRQYAPDGPGGGAPVYPYTLSEESNWSNTLDYTKGHKWLRFRDDDVDDNNDGIYDNWTVPLSIQNAFTSGDYIDKRFKREGTPASFDVIHSSTATMTVDEYYIVESDDIEVTGNLSLLDIGDVRTSGSAVLTTGRTFKYAAGPTYNFNFGIGAGTVRKTIKVPPRTDNGLPNNEPVGWTDTPPVGSDQLWEISGQKSVYGQLKSDWILKKIIEDPNFTRYSNSPSPHPDTLCGVNETATTGSPADLRLGAAGWNTVYVDQVFIARRQDDGGSPPFTTWLVEKIAEESGEYIDRVFKLFSINLDIDSNLIQAPTDRDPSREGWSDSPLVETETTINYVSEARKFFDGTLKSSWSQPVPFTGQDVFTDTLEATPADNFKYDSAGVPDPAEITITSRLYKGITDFWEVQGLVINYTWAIVYNGGAPVNIAPTNSNLDDFYIKSVTGSGAADTGGSGTVLIDAAGDFITKGVQAGDKIWNVTDASYALVDTVISATQLITSPLVGGTVNSWTSGNIYFLEVDNYLQTGQAVGLKPNAVDGQCVIRCTQTVNLGSGDPLVFEDEISILDVTDGKDAKSLTLTADAQRFIYDTVNLVFTPTNVVLRTYWSNIPGVTLRWFVWNTGTSQWDEINNGVNNYTIAGNVLSSTAANRFAANGNIEEIRYAVTNKPTGSPDSADYETTFSDYLTISKLGSANIGSPGDNSVLAILSNEAHTVVLDSSTGIPFTGEVAKAFSRISVFDGLDKLDYNNTEFSITLGAGQSTYFDITNPNDATGDAVISLKNATWVAYERSYVADLTITYGSIIVVKRFSLASTLDAPGAIILDVDSDKGFEFTPTDKSNKTLSAKLYDTALAGDQLVPLPDSAYLFRWRINGVWSGLATTNFTRVITRADIINNGNVTVQVYINGGTVLFRERTVVISDVNDGRSYRAWSDNPVRPTVPQSLSNQNATTIPIGNNAPNFDNGGITVNTVRWRLPNDPYWTVNNNNPIWAQEATEEAGGIWTWTAVFQLTGEKGDQGLAGSFIFPMYKATRRIIATQDNLAAFVGAVGSYPVFYRGSVISLNSPDTNANLYYYTGGTLLTDRQNIGNYTTTLTPPDFGPTTAPSNNEADLATMLSLPGEAYIDWFSRPPVEGIVWRTERLWIGQGVTFNANGDPSTGPVSGSKWTAPVRLSAGDGRAIAGTNGINGGSPIYAVVPGSSPGTKVLQITGWIGNTPSPSFVNQYVGATGFVADIALANPVTGEPVEMRYDAITGFVQWKYTAEGAGSWRNLYSITGLNSSAFQRAGSTIDATSFGTLGTSFISEILTNISDMGTFTRVQFTLGFDTQVTPQTVTIVIERAEGPTFSTWTTLKSYTTVHQTTGPKIFSPFAIDTASGITRRYRARLTSASNFRYNANQSNFDYEVMVIK